MMNNLANNIKSNKIVFIEDNMHDAELIRLSFEKTRFSGDLIRFESGMAFLEYLKQTPSDEILFLILDLEMPRMTGLQVMNKLIEAGMNHFPVIFFSASKDMQSVATAHKLGANAFISKPVHFEEFQQAVKDIWRMFGELNVRIQSRVWVSA